MSSATEDIATPNTTDQAETGVNNESTETQVTNTAEVQKESEVSLHDVIESSHEQFPGKNVEVIVLEADFSTPVSKLCVYDEFQSIDVSGGNFLKGVKWYDLVPLPQFLM
jgi:hypothetical protein